MVARDRTVALYFCNARRQTVTQPIGNLRVAHSQETENITVPQLRTFRKINSCSMLIPKSPAGCDRHVQRYYLGNRYALVVEEQDSVVK